MTQPVEPLTHEQAVGTMACERYLLDELSELERQAFEDHFFTCADCADAVRVGELMRVGAREAGRAQPLAFTPRRERLWTVAVPWAAAASLALIVGYQYTTVPGASGDERSYALQPVTLRPAIRGADVVIRPVAGDPAVVLAIEADAPAGANEWRYELRTVEGKQVTAGRASVQTQGTPLLLWVPASALSQSGRYVLSLRDREDAPPLTEYSFSVVAP